ncbi:MAG: antitoxin MazE family protein [Gammaproteobacteria bacterium]|nr:antitoxin MazE family protein [Gammaproteobacteria bacterium]
MGRRTPLPPKEKQQRYRARLRRLGLRPVQIWVPDTNAPAFKAECRRQVRLLNATADEREALDFIQNAADWSSE